MNNMLDRSISLGLQHLIGKLKNLIITPRAKFNHVDTNKAPCSNDPPLSTPLNPIKVIVATSRTISVPLISQPIQSIRCAPRSEVDMPTRDGSSRNNFEKISAWLRQTQSIFDIDTTELDCQYIDEMSMPFSAQFASRNGKQQGNFDVLSPVKIQWLRRCAKMNDVSCS
jgi:hypothetical protein